MTFGYPSYLWLLLALPPGILLFFWWSGRERRKLMTQFIQARLLPGLVSGISTTRQKIRAMCLILAVVGLVLALAEPRWGYDLEEVSQRGLDIVVAVDVSKSMLAGDIAPNRLARAKLAALDLMQQAKSDRLGLVAFAGTAFLQCPLTADDLVFRQSVESLDVNTIPEGGTALADAIEAAAGAFKEGDNYKVLVLFTDGEDQDSGALEAAKKAAEGGLRIFTVGIGTADGDFPRVKDAKGDLDYIRDEQGNVVKSHLNEALLQQIASEARGFYLPLRGANPIDVLYQKGLAPLPKTELKEKWVKRLHERYHWPLGLAMLLLIVEMFLPERKQAARVRSSGFSRSEPPAGGTLTKAAPTVVAVLALLLCPGLASGSPASALRDYNSGNYDKALKEYERSLQQQGKEADPRLHFNAGAAAYRDQQFDKAEQSFTNALSAPDLALQQRAYYNLGNTLYHLGERNPDPQKRMETWEGAVKQYDNAIQLNTNDADAKFNYSFVKQKLEQLKQQQQKQQSQKDQSQKDQNQQQQQQSQNNQSKDQQQQQQQNQQQQQEQKQDSSQQQQAQNQKQQEQEEKQRQEQQAKQAEEKKQEEAEQQPAQKAAAQEKKEPESDEKPASAQAVPGQMTPQEARQLLDAQKNDEPLLPDSRKEKTSVQRRLGKDW